MGKYESPQVMSLQEINSGYGAGLAVLIGPNAVVAVAAVAVAIAVAVVAVSPNSVPSSAVSPAITYTVDDY